MSFVHEKNMPRAAKADHILVAISTGSESIVAFKFLELAFIFIS